MKLNNLLLVGFSLLFLSISSMEEEIEPTEQEIKEPTVQKVLRPAKIPSLVQLVAKKTLDPLADKAVKIYDQAEAEKPGSGYAAFNKYLDDSEEHAKLPEKSFYDMIYLHIIFDLGRVDIFATELIKLYEENPVDIAAITKFFNTFNFDEKKVIAEWFLVKLFDFRQFDVNFAEKITRILEILIEQYQDIQFYDFILGLINVQIKKAHVGIYYNAKIGEKSLSSTLDDKGDIIISISSPTQIPDNQFRAEILELRQKLINDRVSIFNKIAPMIELTRDLISKIITPILEQENSKYKSPSIEVQAISKELLLKFEKYNKAELSTKANIEKELLDLLDNVSKEDLRDAIDYLLNTRFNTKDNEDDIFDFLKFIYSNKSERDQEIERIFAMLLKKNPESAKVIYYKYLEGILHLHLQLMSDIQLKVLELLNDKLMHLLESNEDIELVDNRILNILYDYYSRFGLEFIRDAFHHIIDDPRLFRIWETFTELESKKQEDILNNLHDLILKFAEEHGIVEEEFDKELAAIDEKINLLGKKGGE